jgi:hypothetical protein
MVIEAKWRPVDAQDERSDALRGRPRSNDSPWRVAVAEPDNCEWKNMIMIKHHDGKPANPFREVQCRQQIWRRREVTITKVLDESRNYHALKMTR